ncbi:DUF6807 domain-containing protein [Plantactinospora soyae]|uniref:Oxidoreductase n=1 Tax=Plantactinospora soyae TaxID=1544732 RepID=A0A927R1S1_9ACTN|nr:PmoA family protein [Plantactinospora soyae]MBE1491717.1 hypothetical protein [Plantactinospora soyae]
MGGRSPDRHRRHPAPTGKSTPETATLALFPDQPPVAHYGTGTGLAVALAPRPYLHPVRTIGGTPVTELMPASHRHHLGAGLAVPDVGGANFWGGRTFVPGHGPMWLDNHGTQRHREWLRREPATLSHALHWAAIGGEVLLAERRTLACRPVSDDAWALDVDFTLTNLTGRPLAIRSPATQGRVGAGYGGFFWRAPTGAHPARAIGPGGADLADLHGATADWLALTGSTGDRDWTLIFAGATERTRRDRWFVRIRDYIGVGSSLAWDRPLVLAPAEVTTRRIVTVIADGILRPAQIRDLATGLGSGP